MEEHTHWVFNNTLLDKPRIRPNDIDQGRHADVKVVNGKAYISCFTHPGRIYPGNRNEDPDSGRWRYRRSSFQVAEFELLDGRIICDKNKYTLLHPAEEVRIPE